jgi:hypothetical protein
MDAGLPVLTPSVPGRDGEGQLEGDGAVLIPVNHKKHGPWRAGSCTLPSPNHPEGICKSWLGQRGAGRGACPSCSARKL